MVRSSARMLLVFALASLATWPALANSPWFYRPVVIDGGPTSVSNAYLLGDIEQASIGYHHSTAAQPQLWFTFGGKYADKVHVQIGVPQLEQYRLLRPLVAIVGRGMPVPDRPLPFALPEGYGALIYDTAAESVENYKESYTGTQSWRFSAEDFHLAAPGACYIVAFTPNGEEGKFWMTVGEERSFRFTDLLTINRTTRKVCEFFEISPFTGVVFWSQMLFAFLGVLLAVVAVSPH